MGYIFVVVLLIASYALYGAYRVKHKINQLVRNEYHYIFRTLVAWSQSKNDISLKLSAIDCMNLYNTWESRVMMYRIGAAEYTPEEVARTQEWKKIIDRNEELSRSFDFSDPLVQRINFLRECFVELREKQSELVKQDQKLQ